MIVFIQNTYNTKKGPRITLFRHYSPEINRAIQFLNRVNPNVNVLTDYSIFLRLIGFFLTKINIYGRELDDAVTRLGQRLLCAVSFNKSFYDLDPIKRINLFADICGEETLEMALTVNGSATCYALIRVLYLQERWCEISIGATLLNMKYIDFLRTFQNKFFYGFRHPYSHPDQSYMTSTDFLFGNVLNNEEWQCVHESSFPLDVFKCLASQQIDDLWNHLNPEGKAFVHSFFKDATPETLKPIEKLNQGWLYLYRSNNHELRTSSNIVALFLAENSNFLMHIDTFHLAQIPQHLRTQASFDQMLTLARGENPTTAVNTYIARLIAPPIGHRGLGDSQSTHRVSVHSSVALSLQRLHCRYSLSESQIQEQVSEFEQLTTEIQQGNFQHLCDEGDGENRTDKVAIRSIARIIGLCRQWGLHIVKERQTGYSLRTIIALMWTAVKDTERHIPNSLHAKENLVRGLAHIQRMYNYGSKVGRDLPSCDGGTINDFVGTLNNIHPDVIIILINKASIAAMSMTYAETIFLEKFEQEMKKDPDFMQRIDQELLTDHWVLPILSRLYEDCIQATVEKIRAETHAEMIRARFEQPQIGSILAEVETFIADSIITLRENKCMFEHAKTRYNAIHNPQPIVQIQEVPKDEFDKLLTAIDVAKNASRITRVSRLFKSVNIQKIDQLCEALREKSYCDVLEWLKEESNRDELKVGIFGRSLKQAFLTESPDDRPFGSPSIQSLSQWIEYCAVDKNLHCFAFSA